MRRLLFRLLLAVALVLAQTGGAAHALSHLGQLSGDRDGHQAPKSPQCDACHAFSAADAADAPPQRPVRLISAFAPALVTLNEALVLTRDAPPFASRAPPTIS